MDGRRVQGGGGRMCLAACCLLFLPVLAAAGTALGGSALRLPLPDRSVILAAARTGLGATIVPRWTLGNFDPRLEGGCRGDDWPVPGGYCYAPDHTTTLTRFGMSPRAPAAPRFVRRSAPEDGR
jgi:DNA-binding transcriptional LysR family regulator